MLVLTRYRAQTITIGDDIKIRVLGVFRGQVRIGIEAPKNIPVHREEIRQRIEEEKNVL